jgi:hypothetical protein
VEPRNEVSIWLRARPNIHPSVWKFALRKYWEVQWLEPKIEASFICGYSGRTGSSATSVASNSNHVYIIPSADGEMSLLIRSQHLHLPFLSCRNSRFKFWYRWNCMIEFRCSEFLLWFRLSVNDLIKSLSSRATALWANTEGLLLSLIRDLCLSFGLSLHQLKLIRNSS